MNVGNYEVHKSYQKKIILNINDVFSISNQSLIGLIFFILRLEGKKRSILIVEKLCENIENTNMYEVGYKIYDISDILERFILLLEIGYIMY